MKRFIMYYPPYAGRFYLKNRPPFPLGPLSIATYLKAHGINAIVKDYGFPNDTHSLALPNTNKKVPLYGWDFDDIAKDLLDGRNTPKDIVGVSSLMSTSYYSAYKLVDIIKTLYPKTKVIMGGPHATIFPEHVFKHSLADFVCIGEGEAPMLEFLTEGSHPHIVTRETLHHIPYLHEDINDIQPLDHDLLDDIKDEDASSYARTNSMMVAFSRGCPMKCEFCTSHLIQGRKWRNKTVDNAMKEILYYHKHWRAKKFEIEDDNLCPGNAGKKWLVELCNRIIKSKESGELSRSVRFHVPHGIPVKALSDKKLCAIMWHAGFRNMVFPLESTNPNVLSDMNKQGTYEDWLTATENWSFEINHPAEIILGYPFVETIETMLNTMLDIAHNYGRVWASHFRLNRNTKLFDRCLEAGYVSEIYDPLAMNSFFVETERFNIVDLKELMAISRGINYGIELGFDAFHDNPNNFVSKPFTFYTNATLNKTVATGSFAFRRGQTTFASLILARFDHPYKPLLRVNEANTEIIYTGSRPSRVYSELNKLLRKKGLLIRSNKGIRKFVN